MQRDSGPLRVNPPMPLWRRLAWGLPGLTVALLAVIWVALPLLPPESGFRFGLSYQLFFTASALFAALLFWLLSMERVPAPRTTRGVIASVLLVLGIAVGSLVTIGVVYPQFALPSPPREGISADAAERGKELFWSSELGCFRCHAVAGQGGTRAPDMKGVAQRAGNRVPGLKALEYIQEKVLAGMTYRYTVPDYAPIMPPFKDRLTPEQLKDIAAYLLSQ